MWGRASIMGGQVNMRAAKVKVAVWQWGWAYTTRAWGVPVPPFFGGAA